MNEISERLKNVRKALDMSRDKFGERLGVSRDVIANIELDRVAAKPLFIQHVCETFNVRPNWMETGDGEMFEQLPRDEALAAEVTRVLYKESDTFRAKLISLLMRLDTEDWEALERIAEKMAEKKD